MADPSPTERRFQGPTPLILHIPHSSTVIPEDVRADLLLDDAALGLELRKMTDWYTDIIAAAALGRSDLEARLVENQFSRLVVDPERFVGDEEPMAAIGMGPVYHSTSGLDPLRLPDPARDEALINRYFRPYAQAFAEVVDDVLAECGRAVIIDLHSFPSEPLPYELDQQAPRPGTCIGTDPFHTPDAIVDIAFESFSGVSDGVALNTPFAGTYVPLAHLSRTPEVSSVMIEIRRDLYQEEPGGPRHHGFETVASGLADLLSKVVRFGV
jgi:N-formylglutamate amidohydrolase